MTKSLLHLRVLRCVLAALLAVTCAARGTVVITEFMAENDGFLSDVDGDSPDWIELQNKGSNAISLNGWYLTDDQTNRTKWTFPATNLAAGQFLVVFASGKNRATNGQQLHVNFQLANDGGYLALVQPDGVTIASEFRYPQQHRNISFGPNSPAPTAFPFLNAGALARWLVPADDALGLSWTAPNFDDSGWSNASTPLHFTAGPAPGAPVLRVDFNDDDSGEVGAANTEAGFDSMTLSSNPSTFGAITVQLAALNGGVLDDRDRGLPTQSGNLTLDQLYDDNIFVMGTTNGNGARVHITGLTPSTSYRLTVWSFDSQNAGARVSDWVETAGGFNRFITNGYSFDGSILPTRDTDATFGATLPSSSTGALTIEGRRNGGTSHGVFLNALQLAPLTGFAVSGNVAPMFASNASLYSRLPFQVGNTNGLNALTLRVKYNDGFVAYLNGTEVARRNAPAAATHDSTATATHSAAVTEDVALPGAPSLLMPGANVLAIHGLNRHSTNADFVLEPQLVGSIVSVAPNGYTSPATPGASNGPAYFDVVRDTKFSVNRGFYDAPFSLSITCATAGAEIRFTTNGSVPSLTNGFAFTAPIPISGHSFIRAAAFLSGWIPSEVDTHSYIFLRDVLRQSNNIPNYPTTWQAAYPADYAVDPAIVNHPVYGATISNDLRSIPSLMIVSDHAGLWGPGTGIYPNSTSTGPAWERAASVELIDGDGSSEFATTSKLEMHGNASRDNVRTPKHSMRLSFNSTYGPTRLNYDWFGGGVAEHNGIILRSCGFVDGWAGRYADAGIYTSTETGETFRGLRYRPENTCYLRDVWVKESFRAMGWGASRSAFVHLYINGLYWGLYEPSERLDGSYFSLLHGGEENAWDVLVGNDVGGPPDIVNGFGTDWTNVLNIVNAGITNEAAYQAVAARVDLDNLIDYMMLHIFAESEDWPHHNWFVAHRRATNGVPGTKFIFSVWDQELTLDRLVRRNRINVNNSGGEVYGPGRVYAQLRAWPEFRRQFGDRIQKHLFNRGALTPSNNVARLLAPAAIIRNAIVGESARWGDARKTGVPSGQVGTGVTFTRDEWWQPEIDKLATNFLPKLTADNVARFRAGNLYPNLGAPEFNQFGGSVPSGFGLVITHTNSSGTIYFTTDSSDPRVYGNGGVAIEAQAFFGTVTINTPTLIRARVLNGGTWSALVEAVFYPPQDLSKLALTEIMYHPPDVGATNSDEFEFVELKNTGTNVLNLSGLKFSGITFTFTNGTLLAPGGFFVLVRNPVAFSAKYPGVPVNGVYTGRLDNGGESLALTHALGGGVFSVTYDDLAPWPVTADDFGFSLVQKEPGLSPAPDDGFKWRASSSVGGSPGRDDPLSFIAPVLINEILTFPSSNPDPVPVDRIELFNPTSTNVNIGGWFLTDDPAFPKKYRIPDGTVLPAGGFATFDESQFNPTPGTNNSFSLSLAGEQVYLFSADASTNLTGYVHGFAFGAAQRSVSFGRYVNSIGEEQFPPLASNTFNSTNAKPRFGPIVINEIHYHPTPDGDEFIELMNDGVHSRPLFEIGRPTNTWRLSGINFALLEPIMLPPNGLLLIVATNPAAFRAKYSVPTNVIIVGPFTGTLQDSGERLELQYPYTYSNEVLYVTVDSVRYNDKSPWPPGADGGGMSLQRTSVYAYGDDPIIWRAAAPTAGFHNGESDRDGDGMPDAWEVATGTDVNQADGNRDDDGDGFTNYQEFLAGTHPRDAQSRLRVDRVDAVNGEVHFEFTAVSNRTFTVQFKDSLNAPSWLPWTNIPAAPQTRTISISVPTNNSPRFYRLAAP